jgi:hypothetical protein
MESLILTPLNGVPFLLLCQIEDPFPFKMRAKCVNL